MPWIIKALTIRATPTPPGIPSVRSEIKLASITAELADSNAAIPCKLPIKALKIAKNHARRGLFRIRAKFMRIGMLTPKPTTSFDAGRARHW